ncbi:MAG: hypothetical protein JJD92_00750 [Frankiaceae bacterium]|nr:hypothetical protein [Frankiaceae bacterium]
MTWPDEQAFHAADPRRRQSAEVDLGATWRYADAPDAHRVAWLQDTGELYVCKADGYDGSCTDVSVLAVVRDEDLMDTLLFGWRDARLAPDGLDWLLSRLELVAA